MIYPTEMTLTTGTTVYAGDPDSDERIQSREVRVSATFRIEEEEDIDLADLAFAKAAEVERARVAALERLERDRTDPYGPSDHQLPFDPSGLEPPDEGDQDGGAPDPFPQEADYLSGPTGHTRNGGGVAPVQCRIAPAGTDKVSPHRATEAETDWATRPQVLAIGSHFKRLGLGHADQTALLRARFGKFRPERLTKDEAAGLMRSLERGKLGIEPASPVTRDEEGRRFTPTPA